MITTIADPFLAQNAGRRYPLADDTTGVPDNAILDFTCSVRNVPNTAFPRAMITDVDETSDGGVTGRRITVGVYAGTTLLTSLTFDIPGNMATSSVYRTVCRTDAAIGEIAVTSAALAIDTRVKNVPFARNTVVADMMKVDSITAVDSVDDDIHDPKTGAVLSPTATLTGEVLLDDGYNSEPYLDGNNIRVEIYKGAGVREFCQPAPEGQTCGNVLFTINGEKPDSNGDIRIVGEDGITVIPHPEEHTIEITMGSTASDTVAKKCDRAC